MVLEIGLIQVRYILTSPPTIEAPLSWWGSDTDPTRFQISKFWTLKIWKIQTKTDCRGRSLWRGDDIALGFSTIQLLLEFFSLIPIPKSEKQNLVTFFKYFEMPKFRRNSLIFFFLKKWNFKPFLSYFIYLFFEYVNYYKEFTLDTVIFFFVLIFGMIIWSVSVEILPCFIIIQ